jgi:hypothetical protein
MSVNTGRRELCCHATRSSLTKSGRKSSICIYYYHKKEVATFGSVSARPKDDSALENNPSTPTGVMYVCMFGVKRNGTASWFV